VHGQQNTIMMIALVTLLPFLKHLPFLLFHSRPTMASTQTIHFIICNAGVEGVRCLFKDADTFLTEDGAAPAEQATQSSAGTAPALTTGHKVVDMVVGAALHGDELDVSTFAVLLRLAWQCSLPTTIAQLPNSPTLNTHALLQAGNDGDSDDGFVCISKQPHSGDTATCLPPNGLDTNGLGYNHHDTSERL
jgi:hypothetical protein